MTTPKKQFKTIDEYVKTFPKDVQSLLQKVRHTIQTAAPEAIETISYQIPTFKLNGRYLIYFAGWKNHISLYPIPSGPEAFQKEISPYIAGKGTLKFPIDKPIPYGLVKKIVTFSIKANLERKNSKY